MPRSTENKLIHIPCTAGINQSTSPRLSPTGTFDTVTNCRISGNGVLEPRPGIIGLTGATSTDLNSNIQAGGFLHSIQSDINGIVRTELPCFACTIGDALMVGQSYGEAFCYSPLASLWQFQGRFSTALPKRKRYGLAIDDISTNEAFGSLPPDIAVNSSGYVAVCALTTSGRLHFYIEDASGVRVYHKQETSTYKRARLLTFSGEFILLLQSGSNINYEIFGFVNNQPGLTSSGTLSPTLASSTTFWDVASVNSTDWIIATHSAATNINFRRYTNGVTQTAAANLTVPSATFVDIALYVDTTNNLLWLGTYDSNSAVSYTVFDVSSGINGTPVVATQTLITASGLGPPLFGRYIGIGDTIPSLKSAFFVFKQFLTGGSNVAGCYYGFASGNSTTHSTLQTAWHYIPISKPDNYNRVWCLHQTHTSNQTTTKLVLLRFADINTVPTIELSSPNQLYLSGYSDPMFFSSWALGTSSSYFAAISALQVFYASKASYRIDVYEHTLAESEPHRASKITGISTTIAGQPVEFYGQSVPVINNPVTSAADSGAFGAGASEIGFPNSPVIFQATPSASGGSLEAGTRSYRAVFEWVDMYGRRHQSAPSPPVTATTTGTTGSVALSISTLNVSQKQSANTNIYVYIKLYRTVVNGTEYHELSTTGVAIDLISATGLVTLTDVESDANISQDGFIYTDGGVLQNDLAPSCRFIAASEDRVWFGGLWDQNIIQASKVIVPGEPIQCTDDPSHQIVLPVPVTALAYMDGNIVIFGRSSIYLVPSTGGPNDQGAGSFASPSQLTRSVGCIDYRSVLETNVGVFFQSALGIYLLPRGFGPVQYVGIGVQDIMSQSGDVSPIVLGAASQISKGNHLAQFLISSAGSDETQAQTILSYDIDGGTWFSDLLHWNAREIASVGNAEGFNGLVYVLSDLSGADFTQPVLYESATTTSDSIANGSTATNFQQVRTNWIHPFGLGGWGKVKRVLVAVECTNPAGSNLLNIGIETDGQPAITSQTAFFTLSPGSNNPVQYREVIPTTQACSACRVTLTGANGAGLKFISITLEIEDSDGARLLVSSEKQ